jgi:hypothetical protein
MFVQMLAERLSVQMLAESLLGQTLALKLWSNPIQMVMVRLKPVLAVG